MCYKSPVVLSSVPTRSDSFQGTIDASPLVVPSSKLFRIARCLCLSRSVVDEILLVTGFPCSLLMTFLKWSSITSEVSNRKQIVGGISLIQAFSLRCFVRRQPWSPLSFYHAAELVPQQIRVNLYLLVSGHSVFDRVFTIHQWAQPCRIPIRDIIGRQTCSTTNHVSGLKEPPGVWPAYLLLLKSLCLASPVLTPLTFRPKNSSDS